MEKHRALTLSLEAESADHLRKLLELALFDLDKLIAKTGEREEGAAVPVAMAGDMGNYQIVYKLGSHAVAAAHASLLEQGYWCSESANWTGQPYSVYEHAEQTPVRLFLDDARITDHDAAEHDASSIRF